jgi:hypothetical protein
VKWEAFQELFQASVQGSYKEIKYVMRVQRGFNSRIYKMSRRSKVIKLSEGKRIRAIVFRLTSGEY